jgi:hypothetical protein
VTLFLVILRFLAVGMGVDVMGIRHWIRIIVMVIALFRRFFIVLGSLSHRFFLSLTYWSLSTEVHYCPGRGGQPGSLSSVMNARMEAARSPITLPPIQAAFTVVLTDELATPQRNAQPAAIFKITL